MPYRLRSQPRRGPLAASLARRALSAGPAASLARRALSAGPAASLTRRARFVFAACSLALGCASPSRPPTAARHVADQAAPPASSGAEATEPVTWINACAPGTPELKAAEAKLTELDALMQRLRPADDPEPALAALRAALAEGCFRISAGDEPTLEADSGHALKAWWNEAGGRSWMEHYLELKVPPDDQGNPSSVIAPTIRSTLTRETRPGHPLAALLCGVGDEACAAETAGFRERAEYAFRRSAEAKRARWLDSDRESPPPESIETCLAKATKPPPDERYAAWRECLRSASRATTRLPLGAMRAPRRGWLLVRGRRGHYAFCDEVRAYDLATGAAYAAHSCSGLALRQDGSVDGRRTDAARRDETSAGRVSVEALREAVWMALFAPEAQPDVEEYWGFAIPKGVEPKAPEDGLLRGLGMSVRVSSSQTTLSWSYVVDGTSIAANTLTWPEDDNDPAREHAVRLLRFAESTLQPGCPSAALPPLDFGGATPGVSSLDAKPSSLRAVERDLVA
ncbi:MAG: hypothetical protein MUF34_15980, partial [Polyangiaceae bacterium]|nr:hypothetical protein [Polyangiaceae bacterium]